MDCLGMNPRITGRISVLEIHLSLQMVVSKALMELETCSGNVTLVVQKFRYLFKSYNTSCAEDLPFQRELSYEVREKSI